MAASFASTTEDTTVIEAITATTTTELTYAPRGTTGMDPGTPTPIQPIVTDVGTTETTAITTASELITKDLLHGGLTTNGLLLGEPITASHLPLTGQLQLIDGPALIATEVLLQKELIANKDQGV